MTDNMTTDNMSNEEVIEILKGIVFGGFDRTTRKERQALNVAIKALEDRPQGEWKSLMWVSGKIIGECPFCDGEQVAENYCSYCGARLHGRN